jgi:hypothetical protein
MSEAETARQNKETTSFTISPFAASIVGALIAVVGAFAGAIVQGYFSLALERQKFESELVIKLVETDNTVKARDNLVFFSRTGFLRKEIGEAVKKEIFAIPSLPVRQTLLRHYDVQFEVLTKPQIDCPNDTIPIVWVESIKLDELRSFMSGYYIARGCENARGQRHGPWIAWYERGPIIQQGSFNNGRREGAVITQYETGAKAGEWHYKEGRRIGDLILWDPNGKEVKRISILSQQFPESDKTQ